MILHIVDDEKFLKSIISIFEEVNPNRNFFLVGVNESNSYGNENIKINENIKFLRINSLEYKETFNKQLLECNLIFYHNLYKTYKLKLIKRHKKSTKIAWYFWGAELYGLNPSINNLLPKTKRVFYANLSLIETLRKRVLSRFKRSYYWRLFKNVYQKKVDYVLTNITGDIDILEQYVKCKNTRYWFTYYFFEEDDSFLTSCLTANNIILGNSSSESNNHIDTFELLRNYNFNTSKIYIPLNYGDIKYRNLVAKEAKTVFGDNTEPLLEFLSKENYLKILKSCSIVIMNHKRQQAFNTIMMALSCGCKVYLRNENTIYKLLKNENFKVYSIQEDLGSHNNFTPLSIEDQLHNKKLILKNYSKNVVLSNIKNSLESIIND